MVNDLNAMDAIPYKEGLFYIFYRGHNDFDRLFQINTILDYLVVREIEDNNFKPEKWTRRFPPGSGILFVNRELTR